MNGIDILSKTILNEVMMKDGKIPLFVLSPDEESFLKNVNSDIREEPYGEPNPIQAILISNGEVKMKIWNHLTECIAERTHNKLESLVIGTNISTNKKETIHLHTIQWIISRLHEYGVKIKIYQNKKIIIGVNIYHCDTLRNSFDDIDLYLDFQNLKIPKDLKTKYNSIIFSFIK